jgi:hypothetical protein
MRLLITAVTAVIAISTGSITAAMAASQPSMTTDRNDDLSRTKNGEEIFPAAYL